MMWSPREGFEISPTPTQQQQQRRHRRGPAVAAGRSRHGRQSAQHLDVSAFRHLHHWPHGESPRLAIASSCCLPDDWTTFVTRCGDFSVTYVRVRLWRMRMRVCVRVCVRVRVRVCVCGPSWRQSVLTDAFVRCR